MINSRLNLTQKGFCSIRHNLYLQIYVLPDYHALIRKQWCINTLRRTMGKMTRFFKISNPYSFAIKRKLVNKTSNIDIIIRELLVKVDDGLDKSYTWKFCKEWTISMYTLHIQKLKTICPTCLKEIHSPSGNPRLVKVQCELRMDGTAHALYVWVCVTQLSTSFITPYRLPMHCGRW